MRPVSPWLMALALVVAACSSATEETTTTTTRANPQPTTTRPATTTTRPITTTADPGPPSPLTGLPVEDPELLQRRLLAVKIDNHPNSRPQSGMQDASVIYEIPVEGITRFLVLFHDTDTTYVGPVRSGRPTDGALLSPFDATFVISGAQSWVISQIRNEGVRLIGEEPPAVFRTRGRRAPHNLYADTLQLRDLADRRDHPDLPPPPLWEFGPMSPTAQRAPEIEVDFMPGAIITWTFEEGRYLRWMGDKPSEHVDEEGETGQLNADVLIVLFADRYTAQAPAGGSSVPAMNTVGRGEALIFADGRVIAGFWSRQSTGDLIELTDEDGEPMAVPPGRSWISLVPTNRNVKY
jgi:hypothetical protein